MALLELEVVFCAIRDYINGHPLSQKWMAKKDEVENIVVIHRVVSEVVDHDSQIQFKHEPPQWEELSKNNAIEQIAFLQTLENLKWENEENGPTTTPHVDLISESNDNDTDEIDCSKPSHVDSDLDLNEDQESNGRGNNMDGMDTSEPSVTKPLFQSNTSTVNGKNIKMKVVKDIRKSVVKDNTKNKGVTNKNSKTVDKEFHIDAALLAKARAAVAPAPCGRKKLPRKNPELYEIEPNKDGTFDCPLCKKTLPNRARFVKHLDERHVEHECGICLQKFPSRLEFQSHRDKLHDDGKGKHKCTHCEKTFYMKNNLTQHLKSYHPETLGKVQELGCPYCDSKLKSLKVFILHIQQNHPNEIVNCRACGGSFHGDKALLNHIKKKHPDDTNALFGCPHCFKSFPTERLQMFHEDIVHQELSLDVDKPYGCSVIHCTKRFRDKWCSARHSKFHIKYNETIEEKLKAKSDGIALVKPLKEKKIGNKLLKDEDCFQCPTCGKLINANDQRKHQEEHQDHICKLCDKNFPTKMKLNAHENKHRSYSVKCPFENCQKTLKSRVLKMHIKIVHHGKRYPCNQCGKSFSAPGDLTLHVRGTHLGIKAQCSVCGKDFNRSSDRNRHERQVHSFERNQPE